MNAPLSHKAVLQLHAGWILQCAQRFSFNEIPLEDRLSVCQMAFLESLKTFNPALGAITTHSAFKMRAALTDLKRELYPWMRQEIEAPIHVGEAELDDESGEVGQASDPLVTEDHYYIIRSALEGLGEREKEIYCHYHGILGYEQLDLDELAEINKVGKRRIHAILQRADAIVGLTVRENYKYDEVI